MAEFLTTQGTSYHLERIIMNADTWLVLISPYLKLSRNFEERLRDADRRNVDMTIIYGKSEIGPDEKARLRQFKNLELRFCDNLHAKCYINEDSVVITSMNMYDFSEKKNREMGVLITAGNDIDVYREARREVESIVRASVKNGNHTNSNSVGTTLPAVDSRSAERRDALGIKRVMNTLSAMLTGEKLEGHCIRCNTAVPLNVDSPLCDEHYRVWARWRDPAYEEKYCHGCGQEVSTTKDKPLCRRCYNLAKRA